MKNEYDYLNEVKMDFTCYEETILKKEHDTMKQSNKVTKTSKKSFAIAACVAALTITTAFASGLAGNIIKTIQTGYNSYHQTDPEAATPLMDELVGKIFDENGVPLESITRSNLGNLYDKDGNKITDEAFAQMIMDATGNLVEVSDGHDREASEKVLNSLEEAQELAVFDIKTPAYLPEDYALSKIYVFTDENGVASGEYINMEYTNSKGDTIAIMERILNENTAFEAGTDGTLEELTINGRTAVIMDNRNLGFETEDDVSVYIVTQNLISKDELIKIAESVQ